MAFAQKRLYIISPYFVPDKHLRKILTDRARAGVDVRLMLPNHFTDAKPIRAASHFYYQDFLEAGVKIYEFSAARLHTKLLIADGSWSIFGSPNLDRRSVELNEENILGVQDPVFAGKLEKIFLDDIKLSKEITLEEWKKRPLLARVWETLCVHFVKQY
jgi:cardiolipin synthase